MENINLNLKSKNLEITPEINSRIKEKVSHIEKFLNLHGSETAIIDVEVKKKHGQKNKQGKIFYAEINLEFKGKLFRTSSKQEDIITAIDDATEEMIRRVRKNKERKIDLIRRGAKRIKKMLRFGNGD